MPYNMTSVIDFIVALVSTITSFWATIPLLSVVICIVGLTQSIKRKERGKIFAILGIIIGLCAFACYAYQVYIMLLYIFCPEKFVVPKGF